MENILFLLGSGVSIKTLGKSVQTINKSVFEKDISRSRLGPYSESKADFIVSDVWKDYPSKVRSFLRVISEYAEEINEEEPDYETLYYLCEQILYYELGLSRNVALNEFVEKIRQLAGSTLLDYPASGLNSLAYTAKEALMLIQGIVRMELYFDCEAGVVNGFNLLLEAVNSKEIGKITIVTLNHDLLLECLLEKNDISYCNGFSAWDGEYRKYVPDLLIKSDQRVVLIKLHGSIDWYLRQSYGQNTGHYISYRGRQPFSIKDSDKNIINVIQAEPSFLSGFGKEFSYNSDIYADMMGIFILSLRDSKYIIESGFGWNDKGVSQRLIRALEQDDSKVLYSLHENNVSSRYFSSLNMAVDSLAKNGQLKNVKSWFSDVTLDELNLSLDSNK